MYRPHVRAGAETSRAVAARRSLALAVVLFGIVVMGVVLISPRPAYAETVVSGAVTQDTTWTAEGSPYVLADDVTVAYGSRLSIEPGAMVSGAGHWIEVFGDLQAHGLAGSEVVLRDLHLRGRGRYVVGQPAETFSIDVSYADIDGGCLQGGDVTMYGSWSITDSIVTNADDQLYLWFPRQDCLFARNLFINAGKFSAGLQAADVLLTDNVFYRTRSDSARDVVAENWAAFGGRVLVLRNNTFLNPGMLTLRLPEWSNSGAIDAASNFWGTEDPVLLSSMVFDQHDAQSAPGTVTVDPVLPRNVSPAYDRLPLQAAVSLSIPSQYPAYAAPSTITATVVDERGAPVRDATVTVEWSGNGGVTWAPVATTATNGDGQAGVRVALTRIAWYRAKVATSGIVYTGAASTSMTVKPRAYLSRPVAPKLAYRGRALTTTGALKTRHRKGARSVTLYYQHKERLSGRYVWVTRAKTSPLNIDYRGYTRYVAKVTLRQPGAWRVYAAHGDADHYRTSSSAAYFAVR